MTHVPVVIKKLCDDERFLNSVLWMGLAWLICAPWVIASAGLYQKVFLALFLVPSLFVFLMAPAQEVKSWDGVLLWAFLLFTGWLALRMGVSGEWKYVKRMLYVFLFLIGMKKIARMDRKFLSKSMLSFLIFSGFMAWCSIIDFYFLSDNGWGLRLVPLGGFKVIIFSAQVVGALLVMTAVLFSSIKLNFAWRVFSVVAMLGFLIFLLLNQTRWVWVSVAATLLMLLFFRRSVANVSVLFILLLIFSMVYLYYPEIFLSRGLSYRDALWLAGLEMALHNGLIGVGGDEYVLLANGVGFTHPHNVYLAIAVRLGLVAPGLWLLLWLRAGWFAFKARADGLGLCALILWVYSTVVVLTDGQIPWSKPAEIWFVTWLPLGLILLVTSRRPSVGEGGEAGLKETYSSR